MNASGCVQFQLGGTLGGRDGIWIREDLSFKTHEIMLYSNVNAVINIKNLLNIFTLNSGLPSAVHLVQTPFKKMSYCFLKDISYSLVFLGYVIPNDCPWMSS